MAKKGYLLDDTEGNITHSDVIKEVVVSARTAPKPTSAFMDDGIIGMFGVALADATTEESRYIAWHVPANYKAGTTVNVHLHYINASVQSGNKTVIFGMEYTPVAHGEDATPATTVVEITENLDTDQPAETMKQSQAIALTGFTADDAVGIRLYRKAGSDTATGDIGIDGIHFLYTSDKI